MPFHFDFCEQLFCALLGSQRRSSSSFLFYLSSCYCCRHVASRRGDTKPSKCFDVIFQHAYSEAILEPETVLRSNVALLGSSSVPLYSFRAILRDADSTRLCSTVGELGVIQVTNRKLQVCIPRLGTFQTSSEVPGSDRGRTRRSRSATDCRAQCRSS